MPLRQVSRMPNRYSQPINPLQYILLAEIFQSNGHKELQIDLLGLGLRNDQRTLWVDSNVARLLH